VPLVACARHKALAVQAELEALAGNTEAAQTQLQATRDAFIAQVAATYTALSTKVQAACAAKRAALEAEAVDADAALGEALRAGRGASLDGREDEHGKPSS